MDWLVRFRGVLIEWKEETSDRQVQRGFEGVWRGVGLHERAIRGEPAGSGVVSRRHDRPGSARRAAETSTVRFGMRGSFGGWREGVRVRNRSPEATRQAKKREKTGKEGTADRKRWGEIKLSIWEVLRVSFILRYVPSAILLNLPRSASARCGGRLEVRWMRDSKSGGCGCGKGNSKCGGCGCGTGLEMRWMRKWKGNSECGKSKRELGMRKILRESAGAGDDVVRRLTSEHAQALQRYGSGRVRYGSGKMRYGCGTMRYGKRMAADRNGMRIEAIRSEARHNTHEAIGMEPETRRLRYEAHTHRGEVSRNVSDMRRSPCGPMIKIPEPRGGNIGSVGSPAEASAVREGLRKCGSDVGCAGTTAVVSG
ncbi:hypothetical protein FIBSPDRAFT_903267 [Athelia psychrophila]|uniref:Uncharacterized protein n=1 Tax=Athelia psychrophila TaxID=1759441 RepID=A0A167W7C9_9AGAM|nr:hypothetical protein FIBSPDRAFT_903267 [Fibularhizoctonia sp. CBS 109695]